MDTARLEVLGSMWFVIYSNGDSRKIQGKQIHSDMPLDAEFVVKANAPGSNSGSTVRITLEETLKQDFNPSSPDGARDWLWCATYVETNGFGNKTYKVKGEDMIWLWPVDMGKVSVTPEQLTVEPGDTYVLTANTTGVDPESYEWYGTNNVEIVGDNTNKTCEFKSKKLHTKEKPYVWAYNERDENSPKKAEAEITCEFNYEYPIPGDFPPDWTNGIIDSAYMNYNGGFAGHHDPTQAKYITSVSGEGKFALARLDIREGKWTTYDLPLSSTSYRLASTVYWEGWYWVFDENGKGWKLSENATDDQWLNGWQQDTSSPVYGVTQHQACSTSKAVCIGAGSRSGTGQKFHLMEPGERKWKTHYYGDSFKRKVAVVGIGKDGVVVIGDTYGSVWVQKSLSDNGSITKKAVPLGGEEGEGDLHCMDIDTDENGVWMVTTRYGLGGSTNYGNVHISEDNGNTWRTTNLPYNGTNRSKGAGVSYGDGVWMIAQYEMVGNIRGAFSVSNDNGKTWTGKTTQPGVVSGGFYGCMYAGNKRWCVADGSKVYFF